MARYGIIGIALVILLFPLYYFIANGGLLLAFFFWMFGGTTEFTDILRQGDILHKLSIIGLLCFSLLLIVSITRNYTSSQSNSVKNKKIPVARPILLIISLISLLCLIFIFPEAGENNEFKLERKTAAQYLQEKYGQNFAIKKVEYFRLSGDSKQLIRTHVVSKDDPPIEFVVQRFVDQPDSKYTEASFHLHDYFGYSYLDLKWSREVTTRFEEVAKTIFLRPTFLEATIMTPGYFKNQKFGMVPSYFETLRTNPGATQDKKTNQFQLIFFYNINEANKAEEAQKIYAFLTEMQKAGILHYLIGIAYFAPEFAAEGQKAIAQIGLNGVMSVEGGYVDSDKYKSSSQLLSQINLSEDDFSRIKDSTELVNEFSKYPRYRKFKNSDTPHRGSPM